MVRLFLLLCALWLAGCSAPADLKGVLLTAGDWDMPPAFHGNPWAPGGVGVARSFVYEPLFDYVPQGERWLPRLGRSFKESPDGMSLTVHLVEGARWHDGEPFSAADVEATFQIGFLTNLEIWHYLDRLEVADEHTVIFHWRLRSPTNAMMALTVPITSAEHLFRKYLPEIRKLDRREESRDRPAESATREVLFAKRPVMPVGTGPFRLTKVTASDMVLERFEQYYGIAKIHLHGVRIARWGRNEVIWSYLYAGQLDAVSPACPFDLAQELLHRNPRLSMRTPSDMNEMGLVLNCRRSPLDKLPFRQALACALDRDNIRRLACAAGDTSQGYSLGIVPSVAGRWLGPDFLAGLSRYSYDPQRARSLLQGQEWNKARELEIMAPAGFTDLALLAEAASSQLTKFGIPSGVRLVPGDLYASLLQDGQFDLAAYFGAQMGRSLHPSGSLGRFFSAGAQLQQATGLNVTSASQDWQKLRMSLDPKESIELTQRLVRQENESVSFIPCFEKRLMIFVQDGARVTGWPASDSPQWSAAPLGVESLYCSLIVQGLLRPAP